MTVTFLLIHWRHNEAGMHTGPHKGGWGSPLNHRHAHTQTPLLLTQPPEKLAAFLEIVYNHLRDIVKKEWTPWPWLTSYLLWPPLRNVPQYGEPHINRPTRTHTPQSESCHSKQSSKSPNDGCYASYKNGLHGHYAWTYPSGVKVLSLVSIKSCRSVSLSQTVNQVDQYRPPHNPNYF